MALSDDYVFKLGDTGTELNTDVADPFVDILRVYGFDSAPIRETERDHEGVDGGFMDAEFEKGRPLMFDGEVFASALTVESFLDVLKSEWAPNADLVPLYFKAPGVAERLMFVKPRGLRYDWEQNRRRGVTRVQFVAYAEDPRVYDAILSSTVITYGGVAGNGFAFTPPSLFDDFSRTVSDGWGTADSGHTYTLTGTATDFDVPGTGSSTITLTAATGTAYFAAPNVFTTTNQWFLSTSNSLSATPTGGTISLYNDLRVVDANNYYRVEVIYTTSNTVQVSLIRVVGGTPTTMAGPTTVAGLTSATGTNIRAELTRGQGGQTFSTFRAKLWQFGTAEPAAWDAEVVTDHVTAVGGMRVGAVRNSGNTNSNPVASRGSIRWMQGISFSLDFGGGAVPTGGTVTNNGNRPTPAIMTIAGPIDNPIIVNDTVGAALNFLISIGAGETLVIDLANKTVLLNGVTNRRSALIAPNWFYLEPGGNFIRFGGTTGGAPTLTIQFRSAWR